MCESKKQCYEGESCRAHVDQLKRLIWVLMIWISILSLGLGASITLQIILHQRSNTTIPDTTSGNPASTRSQLTSYHFNSDKIQDKHDLKLQWRKEEENQAYTAVKIEEDGNYFLFLRVTLNSRNQGVNYTVVLKKTPEGGKTDDIFTGHINETENSTGFLGMGAKLSQNTEINVICSPQAQLDVHNTYLGLIKF